MRNKACIPKALKQLAEQPKAGEWKHSIHIIPKILPIGVKGAAHWSLGALAKRSIRVQGNLSKFFIICLYGKIGQFYASRGHRSHRQERPPASESTRE